jgi:hypothetical protein
MIVIKVSLTLNFNAEPKLIVMDINQMQKTTQKRRNRRPHTLCRKTKDEKDHSEKDGNIRTKEILEKKKDTERRHGKSLTRRLCAYDTKSSLHNAPLFPKRMEGDEKITIECPPNPKKNAISSLKRVSVFVCAPPITFGG